VAVAVARCVQFLVAGAIDHDRVCCNADCASVLGDQARKRYEPRPHIRLLVVIAAVTMTGCESEASTAPVSSSPYGVFAGHVTLTGEFRVMASFEDIWTSRHETCAEYARGLAPSTTLFVVPTPDPGSDVDGHTVQYTAGVPTEKPSMGYQGPGRYSGASAVVSDLIVDGTAFLPKNGASTVITLSANSAGSMSFTGMEDMDTHALESGRIQWTCAG
jgi:hypothetical protein